MSGPGPERPGDDVAQVVLRALLAWPLLGLIAGLVLRTVNDGSTRLVAVGVGGGLGAALAMSAGELVALAGRGRSRRVARATALGGLLVTALLTPALLLGGEFGRLLLERRSSVKATEELLYKHSRAPAGVLDLDASLSLLVVGAALVLGRARGATPRAQATAGAWLVLAALAARLAAGRLESVAVGWALVVEVGVAALAPFQVALADLAVRGARRLLVGRAGPARVAGALGRTLAPAGVAVAWALVIDGPVRAPDLTSIANLEAGWVALLAIGALTALVVARRRGAPLGVLALAGALGTGLPAALLGPDPLRLALTLAGAAVAAAALLPAAGLLLRKARAATGALAPRGRPGRRHLALALALLLAISAGVAAGRQQGSAVRARLGLRLGLDPVALLRRAEGAYRRQVAEADASWLQLLFLLRVGKQELDAFEDLEVAAAERGDRQAILRHGWREDVTPRAQARVLRWLAPLVARGDLDAIELLVRWAPDDARRAWAVDQLLEAGRRGDSSTGLASVWEQCPERRADVEALLAARPPGPSATIDVILEQRGVARPGRPFLVAAAASYRALDPLPEEKALLLEQVLRLDPSLIELHDVDLVAEGHYFDDTCVGGWTLPLAGLDLRPFAPRGPALEAAARGAWATAWASSTAALAADPTDQDALRARAHTLLATARGDLVPPPVPTRLHPGPPALYEGTAMSLADATLAGLGLPTDAPAALDRALCDLHRLVGRGACSPTEAAALLAWLDLALCLAGPDERAAAATRVAPLRATVLGIAGSAGPLDPALLDGSRAALAARLEGEGEPGSPEGLSRRRAASVLRAAR